MINIHIKESQKVNGEQSMFISFPYNEYILNVIREYPSIYRFWHSLSKEWELCLRVKDDFLDKVSSFEVTITEDESKRIVEDNPIEFEFKTKPFEHQIDGFEYGMTHSKWLLGDEQGLGKTKQVIDIACAKKQKFGLKHCLIICGVNGLKWNWANEVKTHSNEEAYILGQRRKRNGKVYISTIKDRLADLERMESSVSDDFPYFIITNVETLRDSSISSKLAELCENNTISIVAIDEIHKCKDSSSQQGKGILKLKPNYRVAMTGTPLMNTPMDLYIILKWLGYEKHAFYSFKQHYCVMGGYGGYEVIGYRHLNELQEQLDTMMLRRLKADVLDLPEKLYINEYVEMTSKQSQIYKEVSADIKANIDQIAISPNPLAQLIRLRQATGFTGILSSTVQESAKLDRLIELTDEAIDNKHKVVIFSNWTSMTDVIYQRLHQKYKGVQITGETEDVIRQSNVIAFQTNDDCKFIIGTIGAMGTGLTLTAGTVMIFADEPWNRALYDQAVDRCHRIGQTQNLTIYNLICKDTIDERIHELVEKKGAMSDAIVDGKITGNRGQLLEFLLS